MVSPQYLLQLFTYNQWANTRTLAAAAALSPEDLARQHGHSWGSVHGVLVHMMAAEWIWLRRLQGQSPKSLLSPEEFPTVEAIRSRWSTISGNLFAYIREQSARSLGQNISFRSTAGRAYTLAAWQVLVHVANHATHHRGELAAMFALMDVSHEEEDWVFYFLEMNRGG